MVRNDIAYAMIRSALTKGVKDIQENPERGIRNLVDLGGMFADGRFQKEFFEAASTELEKEDSTYYRLVEQIVRDTDATFFTGFGMNLAYHCWTENAREIRRTEAEQGFNVPWCVMFDLSVEGNLKADTISDVIRQGKELGIYAYLLLSASSSRTDDILRIAKSEPECAFMLFAGETNTITDDLAQKLLNTTNVWLLFDLDSPDVDAGQNAAAILKQNRCFFGGYSRYADLTGSTGILMKRCEKLGVPFLVMVGQKNQPTSSADLESFYALRTNLTCPVFPIDLYADVALIDRNISSEACLTMIRGDGSVITTDAEEMSVKTGYNISNTPLRAILVNTMPKKQRVTRA